MRGVDLRQKTFRLNSLKIGRNNDQNQKAISDLKAVSIPFRYDW
jgi:hypothetical protein